MYFSQQFLTVQTPPSYQVVHFPKRQRLYAGTVPVNKKHPTGTVAVNKEHLTGSLSNVRAVWPCLRVMAFCAGCWHAVQQSKNESLEFFQQWHIFYLNFQPSSDSSLTKAVSLQTTGSPQGTGFPSISGQNSGTFGAALRGCGGNFLKIKLFQGSVQ